MKVKKEVSLAIIIGLLIALLVTVGILRAQSALKNIHFPDGSFKAASPTPSSLARPQSGLFLDISTPDNSVTQTPTLTLAGTTVANTYIAILGESGEYLIVPNELGSFSQDVKLVKGANSISITVYTSQGDKLEKTLNAVYTTAEI